MRAAVPLSADMNCRRPMSSAICLVPNGIMHTAMWGRLPRFKLEVCGVLQSPIMLQCMSSFMAQSGHGPTTSFTRGGLL